MFNAYDLYEYTASMIFTASRSHFTEAFNISQQNCFHLIIHKILPAMTNGAP